MGKGFVEDKLERADRCHVVRVAYLADFVVESDVSDRAATTNAISSPHVNPSRSMDIRVVIGSDLHAFARRLQPDLSEE